MTDEEIEEDLATIEDNKSKMQDLKDYNSYLINKICSAKGKCPRCLNTHYPHC